MNPALYKARMLLENITPLKSDCGRLCGHACCLTPAEETRGMLLFPGEEEAYADSTDVQLVPSPLGTLLICSGQCSRTQRPLSCRMFPLLPLVRAEGIRVAMDRRGRVVCPLTRMGRSALDPAFVQAVAQAGQLLLEDDEQADFLRRLTREQDDWRELAREWGAHQ